MGLHGSANHDTLGSARGESAHEKPGVPLQREPRGNTAPRAQKIATGNHMSSKPGTRGLRPGNKAPASGQYRQIGPRGGKGPEVTVVKHEPLPPTSQKGSTYTLVDPTKNKSGRA